MHHLRDRSETLPREAQLHHYGPVGPHNMCHLFQLKGLAEHLKSVRNDRPRGSQRGHQQSEEGVARSRSVGNCPRGFVEDNKRLVDPMDILGRANRSVCVWLR